MRCDSTQLTHSMPVLVTHQGVELLPKLLVVYTALHINRALCRQHTAQCWLSAAWREACAEVRPTGRVQSSWIVPQRARGGGGRLAHAAVGARGHAPAL